MKQTKKRAWILYLMVLPAFSVMVLVVVLPILNTVQQSFRTDRLYRRDITEDFPSRQLLQLLHQVLRGAKPGIRKSRCL